jgi:transposase InsO family protein
MTRRTRRNHTAAFKAKVALAAVKGDKTLEIMRRIDELHLEYPFAGSRMLRDFLRGEGVQIGRQRVITMMRRMEIEAIYRRPNTSKPAAGHRIYPYLLRGLAVERPNQVWAMDITYIPMAQGYRRRFHLSNANPCPDKSGHR